MSTSIVSSFTNVANNANTQAANPKGQLAGQDFMKLLLTELSLQDPTSPMDTDKMMNQTTQLSTLEAQTATKTAMESMTTAFKQSAGYGLASTIGHLADTGDNSLALTAGQNSTLQAYFPADSTSGSIVVKDTSGNTVKTVALSDIKKGVYTATWDGKDTSGTQLPTGTYKTYLTYTDSSGNAQGMSTGTYPISGVQMPTSTAEGQVLLGTKYVAVSKVKTIY
ncbi:MAG: hypothetical protein RL154_900 [Pseudomonadota bacterium]|jgi:flagellar basal-body rod modification protein FlgD